MNSRTLFIAVALFVSACVQDEGDGTSPSGGNGNGGNGTANGNGGNSPCGVDPAADPPQSGQYDGNFEFDEREGTKFPLSMVLQTGSQQVSGTVRFNDGSQDYEGTISGTWAASGLIQTDFTGRGEDDGRVVSGTTRGTMDANGGCGTWENTAGQTGPWFVGDYAD